MLKRWIKFFLISIVCFVGSSNLFGRTEDIKSFQTDDLFSHTEPLDLIVYADFEALKSNRDKTVPYQKVSLSYVNNDTDTIKVLSQIRVRGNYRLRETTCSFPPLKFKFRSRDVDSTIFEGCNRLKLVTHCQDDEVEMHNSAMRELLAYQIYNEICDFSLQVRLVNVVYVDINTEDRVTQRGFFIEDVECLSRRNNMEEFNSVNLTMEQLSQNNMIRMSMFQLMIGNNDWSVPKLHNVVLMREGTHTPPIAVPYDFDMSAFVNAPYRKSILGEEEVRCVYKGHRVEVEELEETIDLFVERRGAIVDLILDFPYLDVKNKQLCLQKIDEFYNLFDHKSSIRRTFVSKPKS
ncbi:hypothetical protein [Carboxylicivirga sp. N1Y90]|uniref:hypothetical protein n=1 Tax=Carboxylicivirga fragile TaxID=3417571 RepID=UPI003D33AF16|nr:hypothetical protein [Marinilabiliaceae bacterium N1Y90]